jgi:methylglyoxal synthase
MMKKSIISIFAGKDSTEKNKELGKLLAIIYHQFQQNDKKFANLLKKFFFFFTSGTFDRMFFKEQWFWLYKDALKSSNKRVGDFLKNCVRMPGYREGGIIHFANLVVSQKCSIVWAFLDPHEAHCTRPENMALLRLCDVWKAKWHPNIKSVIEWIRYESENDANRSDKISINFNQPQIPIQINPSLTKQLNGKKNICNGREYIDFSKKTPVEGGKAQLEDKEKKEFKILVEKMLSDKKNGDHNMALIAHDNMKPRMVEFVTEYKKEIDKYVGNGKILTTQTTGKEIEKNILDRNFTKKIEPCLSGPFGGDIQIATAILMETCHTVIFFIDPLNPHPHIDDIRVVLMAGMTNPEVRVLTNETSARAWAEVLREN